jgi:hypothetical protein
MITAAELKKREKEWILARRDAPRYPRGVPAKYAHTVTSASRGAVTDADLAAWRQPKPKRFPAGIDASLLVLDAPDGARGVEFERLVAGDVADQVVADGGSGAVANDGMTQPRRQLTSPWKGVLLRRSRTGDTQSAMPEPVSNRLIV